MFSRKAETNPVPLDLNRQVRNAERLLSRTLSKMIRIEMRLPDDLGLVHADPAQMDQIVLNLAINAKEAMPDGGILTLEPRTSRWKVISAPVILELRLVTLCFSVSQTLAGEWTRRSRTGCSIHSLPSRVGIREKERAWDFPSCLELFGITAVVSSV